MSEFDQVRILKITDKLLAEVEGMTVLDQHGRFLAWRSYLVDRDQVEAVITQRHGTLIERLRWALRPKRLTFFL